MLLFFYNQPGIYPTPPPTFQCWRDTNPAVTQYKNFDGVLDTWNFWETSAWSDLYNQNRTWHYLSGDWFVPTPKATTTWNAVIEGSCPIV